MTIHTENGIDLDELRDLCLGKLQWRKCQCCDNNGRQYWDSRYTMGMLSNPSGIPEEHLDSDTCYNCFGLGFILYKVP